MGESDTDNVICNKDNVYGSYVHGIFDNADIAKNIVGSIAKSKGIYVDLDNVVDRRSFMEADFEKLENTVRNHVNMEEIYRKMGL